MNGPGLNNQSVIYKRPIGKPTRPAVWDCLFKKKHQKKINLGIVIKICGKKCGEPLLCGGNSSLNYQFLYNHVWTHWGLSQTQKQPKRTPNFNKGSLDSFFKKKKPNRGASIGEGSAPTAIAR